MLKTVVLQNLVGMSENDPIWQNVYQMLFANQQERFFNNRPCLTAEDLRKMDCDLPPEPEWEAYLDE